MNEGMKILTEKVFIVVSGSGEAGIICEGGQVLCWEITYVH